ncbi:MAG: glycosyltransferase family 4 protein [Candidatus Pacebacteria bacterium]|nr:glycosyltransferase family 4 protein [Candidatus Paceibacterota bacterium]
MRKKILQIITLSEWGGAQRVVFDLADNLDKEKFEVEVACGPDGLLIEKLEGRNIKVHIIKDLKRSISPLSDVKAFLALKKLIKKGQFDIVHCHSAKAGFLGRMAAKQAGVKKIFYTVHSWGFYNQEEYGLMEKTFVLLEKISAVFTTKIICVANKVMVDGIKRKITRPAKLLAIKNGIDFNVANKRDELRKSYNLKPNDVVCAMVARLAYPKNPLFFLQIAREVVKENDKTKFVLVGDGPIKEECQNFIKKEKLEEKVLLLGEKSPVEARELFFAFDVFVLTSKFEGMPITILEAMFASLPVIASNVGGISELVDSEKGGFLIKNNYFGEAKERFEYLIKNPQLRKQMGEYNLQKARADFTLNKMVEQYEDLYNSLGFEKE